MHLLVVVGGGECRCSYEAVLLSVGHELRVEVDAAVAAPLDDGQDVPGR